MDQKISVKTSDGTKFEITDKQIKHLTLLKNILNCCENTTEVDLNITSSIFENVLDFISLDPIVLNPNYEHYDLKFKEEEIMFLQNLVADDVINLCTASNYLEFYYLLEITAFIISEYFSDKNLNEMKNLFNDNQITGEERKKCEKEYQWMPEKKDE